MGWTVVSYRAAAETTGGIVGRQQRAHVAAASVAAAGCRGGRKEAGTALPASFRPLDPCRTISPGSSAAAGGAGQRGWQ